ncbi:hypothetical protein [Microbacterium paulum]
MNRHSEPSGAERKCAWIQASRNPSRARKASCATAAAFMPSSGATSAGFICSISVYQSTSCQRVGSARYAWAVRLRSSASSVACASASGSGSESTSSIGVSRYRRPQPAAV